ncbi:Uma2 family endonuclease [Actinomadura fibrosa]|uniref:Uma2 family endonuclease n=1 Tax=Actinomadura fibrosa TaxID=111802 RepID=A0ABW2XVR3_9ACTN|nr:Uma2 family endonuclease [Actinomadura fibrosa]
MQLDGRVRPTLAATRDRLADFAEARGFPITKVEAVGDRVVVSVGTHRERDATIAYIADQIPREISCKLTGVPLRLTSEQGILVPDLVVPESSEPGVRLWAHETELLVEVVSQGNFREDHEGKRLRYAKSGAPQYLLVDPRDGICVLNTGPLKGEGRYKDVVTFKFGEPIAGVLCMDGADLDTSEFLRYT